MVKERPVILRREVALLGAIPYGKAVLYAMPCDIEENAMADRWKKLRFVTATTNDKGEVHLVRTIHNNTLKVLEVLRPDKLIPGWDIENMTGLTEHEVRQATQYLGARKLIESKKNGHYWTSYKLVN
jgi:hypothetical protein